MVNQNSNSYPTRMLTLEYATSLSPQDLKVAIQQAIKSPQRLAGSSVERGWVLAVDFKSKETARFQFDAAGMLRIISPASMQSVVSAICHRLTRRRAISAKEVQGRSHLRPTKSCEPARDVLARHMAKPEFQDTILVLPEAIAGAESCKYRGDGTLDRYLTRLVEFAKLALKPENREKLLTVLADQAGLGHFGADIGETAVTQHRSDYNAIYGGVDRVFRNHVTLGAGLNEADCMSIYFLIDHDAGKLVIGRFGRHGKGAG
jgi:hypothetical protein